MNIDKHSITYFQQKIYKILVYITLYGFIPLLWFGSIFYYLSGDIIYGLIEDAAGLILLFSVLNKKLSIKSKKKIIIYTLYMFSIFLLITTGKAGAGFICIFATMIFAAIIYDYKDIMLLFLHNLIVFIILTGLLYLGLFDRFEINDYRSSWIIQMAVVNIAAYAIISLMNFIINTIQTEFLVSLSQTHYLDNVLNSIDECFMTLDMDLTITILGKKIQVLFNIDESVIGMNYSDLISMLNRHPIPQGENHENIPYLDDQLGEGQYCLYSENHLGFIYINFKKGTLFDELGEKKGYILYFLDITEKIEQAKKVIYLEDHDQLTGLFNRKYYTNEISKLYKAKEFPISVIMADINGLKLINDSFGYSVGEKVIESAAKCIKDLCPPNTMIARMEGGFFSVILPRMSLQNALLIMKDLKDETKDIRIDTIQLSMEFACSSLNNEFDQIEDILRNNNEQIYRKKITSGASIRSQTIDLIMQTLYEKNPREMHHSHRVSTICVSIGKILGLDSEELGQLRIAGLMHDIGKIGISEEILNKPGRLTIDEFAEIKKHSEIGYRILSSVPEFSQVALYVLQHQEKWDGTGYPQNLKTLDILLPARIIAIADAYDAMTRERTYKAKMSREDALIELKEKAGTQFDPTIIDKVLKHDEIFD